MMDMAGSVTADTLKTVHMRETMHINGGPAWFGYIFQCVEHPRLTRFDRYDRKTRSVASTFRVDGEDLADIDAVVAALNVPALLTEDEREVLERIPDEPTDLRRSEDIETLRGSLRAKAFIIWNDGKCCRTDAGRAANHLRGPGSPQQLLPGDELMDMDVIDEAELLTKRLVVFENDGLIDPIGITTFGVNAKTSENPIGYFGTGLKYAIAVLLRCGQKITIYRGHDALEFSVQVHESRGKEFSVVCMNDQQLGFTTDLGKTWEMWQAFRELACNCTDEGGTSFETTDFNPRKGRTSVVVEGDAFFQAYQKRGDYLLQSQPIMKLDGLEVHDGASQTIFYRGIAVARFPDNQRPLHTYNIIGHLELTEDRTVKYSWQPAERVASAIQLTDNVQLIEEVLRANPGEIGGRGGFEASLDFNFHGVTPNQTFIDTVIRLENSNGPEINKSARAHAEKFTTPPPPEPLTLDATQKEQLDTAMGFCADLGFDVDRFPIRTVVTLNQGVMGMALGNEIILTRNAFDAGTKQVAITLIEEFIHIHHGVRDATRAMQERILHELVNIGERHLGRAL